MLTAESEGGNKGEWINDSQCVPIPGLSYGSVYSEVWVSGANFCAVPTAKVGFVLKNGKRVLDDKGIVYIMDEDGKKVVGTLIVALITPTVHLDRVYGAPASKPVDPVPPLVQRTLMHHRTEQRRLTAVACICMALMVFLFWYWSSIRP